jgi:hypothetical protein
MGVWRIETGKERRERLGERGRGGEGHRVVERADVEEARHDVEGTCILWLDPYQISVEKAVGYRQQRGDPMMCGWDWWISKECFFQRGRKREGGGRG